MNNKEYQLLMENWRSYVNESRLDEGLKEQITQFAQNALKKLDEFIKNNTLLNTQQYAELAKLSPKITEISKDIAQAKKSLETDVNQIKSAAANKQVTENLVKQFLAESDQKKELEEFGLLAATGIGLGALGGLILATKVIIWAGKKFFKAEMKGAQAFLTSLEQIEQKIKNFISSLKVLDMAGYQIIKFFLGIGQNDPSGRIGSYFTKSGIKIYMQKGKQLPDFKVISHSGLLKTDQDIAQHVQHHYADQGHGNIHEAEQESGIGRPERKRMEADTGVRLSREEAAELKKLVAMNQKLVYMALLSAFGLYGATTIASHGVHGILGIAELGATGVKATEIGQTAVNVLSKAFGV